MKVGMKDTWVVILFLSQSSVYVCVCKETQMVIGLVKGESGGKL